MQARINTVEGELQFISNDMAEIDALRVILKHEQIVCRSGLSPQGPVICVKVGDSDKVLKSFTQWMQAVEGIARTIVRTKNAAMFILE